MKIHLLSGFLGSGKTTAIQHACHELISNGSRVGVVTNDQGSRLVDGDLFEHLNIPGRQVANGCFCCNYADLDRTIESLVVENNPDVIFAESVGSCTDIVATVMKPLLHYRPGTRITVSTFADIRLLQMLLTGKSSVFDESVRYIYFKQLEEANIIVVSKIDLVDNTLLENTAQLMKHKYSDKIILYQNSLDNKNIHRWLDVLDNAPLKTPASLQIDYDVYGEGEAKLAWYDQELEINSIHNNAMGVAISLTENIYTKILHYKYPIGHLKFLLNGETKISFTSTSEEITGRIKTRQTHFSILLINARIETSPRRLSQLISRAIEEVQSAHGAEITIKSTASFQPGYPKPTHRIAD